MAKFEEMSIRLNYINDVQELKNNSSAGAGD